MLLSKARTPAQILIRVNDVKLAGEHKGGGDHRAAESCVVRARIGSSDFK
jgi:hypothetical protein